MLYKRLFIVTIITLVTFSIYHIIKVEILKHDIFSCKWGKEQISSDTYFIGKIASLKLYEFSEIDSLLNQEYYKSRGIIKKEDTIFLDRTYILFKNDSLISIEFKK